jgi:hypothetical protein
VAGHLGVRHGQFYEENDALAGINRALQENRVLAKSYASAVAPCIFLSHISIDKSVAVAIGNYITAQGGIDIYLDFNDHDLQRAANAGDAVRVTQFIESGLLHSTHIMCLVSASTVGSWWVPYELGFGKRSGKPLSTMKLKGEVSLPGYLAVSEIIKGTRGLNAYLAVIRGTLQKSLTEALIPHTAVCHPLDPYIDWNA